MFTKRLSANALPHNSNEATKIRSLMTIMAWICLIVGVVLSLITIRNYSDQNHTLMIGIGFLVASVHIYSIGTFMGLMLKRMNDNKVIESDMSKEEN